MVSQSLCWRQVPRKRETPWIWVSKRRLLSEQAHYPSHCSETLARPPPPSLVMPAREPTPTKVSFYSFFTIFRPASISRTNPSCPKAWASTRRWQRVSQTFQSRSRARLRWVSTKRKPEIGCKYPQWSLVQALALCYWCWKWRALGVYVYTSRWNFQPCRPKRVGESKPKPLL